MRPRAIIRITEKGIFLWRVYAFSEKSETPLTNALLARPIARGRACRGRKTKNKKGNRSSVFCFFLGAKECSVCTQKRINVL